MGNEVCSCSQDSCAARYAAEAGQAPEYPWQDESTEKHGYAAQRGEVYQEMSAAAAPAARTAGNNRKGTGIVHKNTVPAVEDDEDDEQKNGQAARPAPLESPSGPLGPSGFGGHPPASPASSSSSPNCRSPASMRQSWQDLDADGNYNLGFNYRQGDRFGLQLVEIKDRAAPSSSVGLLVVAHVELSGPFAYTSKNSPGLFPGDLITKANGSRGTADTLRDIVNQITTAGGQLDLVVQSRPAAFDVQLKREGPNHKKLGLSVAIDKADTIARMRVLQVRDEGLIPKWNETNGLLRICRDDWITQVNGVTGNAKDMYNALLASSEGQELEFRVETPSRDAPRKEPETGSPMRTPQGSPQSSPNHRTS